jgi:hypothetical protein
MKNEKFKVKKMFLSKETIVRLSSWGLNQIKGGQVPTWTKPPQTTSGGTAEGPAGSISNNCCC